MCHWGRHGEKGKLQTWYISSHSKWSNMSFPSSSPDILAFLVFLGCWAIGILWDRATTRKCWKLYGNPFVWERGGVCREGEECIGKGRVWGKGRSVKGEGECVEGKELEKGMI